ncbi:hypothetical protein B1J93_13580 [Leptospira kirschneri serovar Pomona]|uniref:Uncharacterized protein n=1 Tax=Leptospira kirschneri serovar Pomona TaxID=561005 RepID=A0A1T1DKG7_9LEPT|nr:hypothetical protein AYB32_15495 [Leptospira kirschneri]KXZ31902.1 hypothetical protein AYB34_14915 [Leptospira sp. ZV016]OOV41322.1 hypothetical protein B1J93_13580 [Leptospira kirschneri serovar Pomona]
MGFIANFPNQSKFKIGFIHFLQVKLFWRILKLQKILRFRFRYRNFAKNKTPIRCIIDPGIFGFFLYFNNILKL